MSAARRIIIVEDEPNVRFVFRAALESDAYTLTTAEDGETALRWLSQEPSDLVLLDLRMPGIGGMEVLRRLRAAGSDVPVIVITAHDSVANAVEAMKLGAIDFLAKPLTPEALRQVVAEVLARHPKDEPEQALAGTTRRPHDMLSSAKRALNHRLFYRAEGLLKEAMKERPGSAEPWYLLGVLHEVQLQTTAAREAYEAALRIDPGYEPAELQLLRLSRTK
jgi:DNA-binding NtrC family response regulator